MFIILSLNKETVTKIFMLVSVMLVLQFLPVSFIVEINMGSMVIVFLFFFVFCNVHVLYNKIIHV